MGVALHKTQQRSNGFGLPFTATAEDAFCWHHKYQALFFGSCTQLYFCIVNVVITAWVVNYSAPILILKLNIRAYKQTKIFWQPKLIQLYRVHTLYFLNLACLPITKYFIKKAPCLEIQANSRIQTCAKRKVLFQSSICSVVSIIRFIRGCDLLEKYKQWIEIKNPVTFHCKEQQFHNAFLIRKEHQMTHMLVAEQLQSWLFAICKITGFSFFFFPL